ncbi:Poly(A) polymerase [Decorospora gaudefroyi]|uniref:Poly(A) polymerase n=1 Tax=Decorospora gaudefroyi TaxID=184978 RepID=A0A6A5KJP0_9PLEO|nr:Poly(A) polymerase [Decorospora gaudefroyi]
MDAQKKGRQFGITSAISEAAPTEHDIRLNDKLIETLKRENVFETPEGNAKRTEVIKHIQTVVEEFVRRVGKQKGVHQNVVDAAGGKIFTFGSYALGVHGPASDIDTLVVAPKFVSIDDFFLIFPPTFREYSKPDDIDDFVPVEDAFVPIIKMEYRGVSIDLLFASLPKRASIPANMETIEKKDLEGLSESATRSVNGTRVTKELLAAVPQNVSFRHALRAIKIWANRRGIYGAVFGYPGGVAWAIMVARICQLYPMANGATIVSKFFSLMYKWTWPRPVMLKHIEEGELGLRVWNPQLYGGDRAHLMPIITPAFPSMCATHTVMPSTLRIMKNEFGRADQILQHIFSGTKSWDALFERHSFFTKDHKYYLSVVAASRSKEANSTFSGLVQSKIRHIVKGIDDGQTGIDTARPYIEYFERVHRCKGEDQVSEVTQGVLDYMIAASDVPAEGTVPADSDVHFIFTTTFYIGLTLPPDATKSLDISYPVGQFKNYIIDSDLYDEKTMSVKVVHTRNTALPDDVFQPGETRPKKPSKEKKKNAKSVKRQFADTGLDVRDPRLTKYSRRSSTLRE